jgi:cyanobactin maturation PatA/PatG family protease
MKPNTNRSDLGRSLQNPTTLFLKRQSQVNPNSLIELIPGISELHEHTLGDPHVRIALLDGPVSLKHPCFKGAKLQVTSDLAVETCSTAGARSCDHGTRVASIIFGQHSQTSPHFGIAPACSGLVIPIFNDRPSQCGQIFAVSQDRLARAINIALHHRAAIINVSAGQLGIRSSASTALKDAVSECVRRGVIVIAAAGNEGRDCTHLPGVLPGVLVVGAVGRDGRPAAFSNYGAVYGPTGLLAPGEDIPCASYTAGVDHATGTSFAVPIVSGVVALLLALFPPSDRLKRRTVEAIRSALLASTVSCGETDYPSQCLSGILSVPRVRSILTERGLSFQGNGANRINVLNNSPTVESSLQSPLQAPSNSGAQSLREQGVGQMGNLDSSDVPQQAVAALEGNPSCACNSGPPQLVYALGQIGHDLLTQARHDSLKAAMEDGTSPTDARQLLKFLEKSPFYASAVAWTLNLGGTPIYALAPGGPYAAETFNLLRQFYSEQFTEGVERVSIPGTIVGNTELMNGQVVPTVVPELRGMASWTTMALLDALLPAKDKKDESTSRKRQLAESFLAKVYHKLRNFGRQPDERAVNFAATNAYQIKEAVTKQTVFERAATYEMELDDMEITRSPISRPGSDCWDVELSFYRVEDALQRPRQVSRFTVDVSDIVPVLVGPINHWSQR